MDGRDRRACDDDLATARALVRCGNCVHAIESQANVLHPAE